MRGNQGSLQMMMNRFPLPSAYQGFPLVLSVMISASTVMAQRPEADLVLGQPTFFVSGSSASTSGVSGPQAVAVDPTSEKVFLADTLNHRVLRFQSVADLANGAEAEAVFGQPDFTSNQINRGQVSASADRLASPGEVFVDSFGTLWVSDSGNHRVLAFFNASSQPMTGGSAGLVLGQGNYADRGSGLSRSRMSLPKGICADREQHVWVADSLNHRVLRFDNVYSIGDGANASRVLGQSDFVSNDVDVPGDGGATAAELELPKDLALDSAGNLYVAEETNHRVVVFANAATLGDGVSAVRVLGQPDLTTVGPLSGMGAADLWYPYSLGIDEFDRLYVSQKFTNRVTWFNRVVTKGNGGDADGVIGQDGFTQNSSDTNQTSLTLPEGLGISGDGALWLADTGNHRILRLDPSVLDKVTPLLKVLGKRRLVTKRRKVVIRGTASDNHAVTRVEYRTGAAWLPVSGQIAWRQTIKSVKRRVLVGFRAIDPAGNFSSVQKVTVLGKRK